jgi:hypothetical protein
MDGNLSVLKLERRNVGLIEKDIEIHTDNGYLGDISSVIDCASGDRRNIKSCGSISSGIHHAADRHKRRACG